jgi:LacI family transcriptional regulator
MIHQFPLKEIASQSGLSHATVDRALHGRAHVSAQTARRVQAAIAELAQQEGQLAARGRRMFVDIVVEAPRRFSDELRRAVLTVLPKFTPAVIRPRYHFAEDIDPGKTVKILANIASRGSQGIILKAQNVAPIRAEIARLAVLKIPVATVFTDCPDSGRLAYAGLNNENAGRTAAYLFYQSLRGQAGTVLTATSRNQFQGEEARALAFADEMARLCPNVDLIDASGGAGLALGTSAKITAAVQGLERLLGVYSMGGGNAAIIATLAALNLGPDLFVAHDLDRENRQLLRQGRLGYVLHHDLSADLDSALQQITAFHKLRPPVLDGETADVQIITPANCPVA